jgi:lipopolysaccharide export LptBFGC system permease protein LptF|tara:strand:- start:109 stop:336 length:228 start_codon:yes stop_codon:yes gene_type:complete
VRDVTLYLIANPLIAIGTALLGLLFVYNMMRRQVRIAVGMWLAIVAVLFYVLVQVSAETDELSDIEMVAPPGAQQ